MKMKGALKPPNYLIWNKYSIFNMNITSSILIVEDTTTAVISLIQSDANMTLIIMNLQINYTATPKTYDIYLFVIKVGLINVSGIIINNSKSSNIMSLQNVNGTVYNSLFYNTSIQTAGALFYYPVSTLLFPCQISFNNVTINQPTWTALGSLATEKAFFFSSAINNLQVTITNFSFLFALFTSKCYVIFIINNINIFTMSNSTFWNFTSTSNSLL